MQNVRAVLRLIPCLVGILHTFAGMSGVLFKLLLGLAMAALAKAFPAPKRPTGFPETNLSESALRRYNAKGNLWALVAFLTWMFGATILIGRGLYAIAFWMANFDNDAPVQLLPDRAIWYIVGGLFMFASVRQPVEGFVRLVAGQEAIEAMNIHNERHYGIDVEAFWRFFARFFAAAGVIALLLIADYEVRVYDDHIMFNDWKTLFVKRDIPFGEISAITYAKQHARKNGNSDEPAYFLRFRDEWEWRSVEFDIRGKEHVFDMMGKASGVGIDTVGVWR
jgi:hypothetical protein